MSPADWIVCVSVLADLSSKGNTKFTVETHVAVAQNICAAANKDDIEPRILAAYILTENAQFDPFASRRASVGEDLGLYQSNSYFHGRQPNFNLVNHPYYATEIAGAIIKENFQKFGRSWKAIAAYWNPTKAKEGRPDAIAYYNRWLANYRTVERKFEEKQRTGISKEPA
jgi:hypothetical protein